MNLSNFDPTKGKAIDLTKMVKARKSNNNDGAKPIKYGKKVTKAERQEVVIYKYFRRVYKTEGDNEAVYTTLANKIIDEAIGGTHNMKFRHCKVDSPDDNIIYGRNDGVRMMVCNKSQLHCRPEERTYIGGL